MGFRTVNPHPPTYKSTKRKIIYARPHQFESGFAFTFICTRCGQKIEHRVHRYNERTGAKITVAEAIRRHEQPELDTMNMRPIIEDDLPF